MFYFGALSSIFFLVISIVCSIPSFEILNHAEKQPRSLTLGKTSVIQHSWILFRSAFIYFFFQPVFVWSVLIGPTLKEWLWEFRLGRFARSLARIREFFPRLGRFWSAPALRPGVSLHIVHATQRQATYVSGVFWGVGFSWRPRWTSAPPFSPGSVFIATFTSYRPPERWCSVSYAVPSVFLHGSIVFS